METAHEKQQKGIGLTTAVVAVLMAIANLLANAANTQRVVVETKIADWWAYTHSNDTNARIYMSDERIAQLHGDKEAAEEFHKLYQGQTKVSDDARVMAQKLEKDSGLQGRKAFFFEIAVLFLEVSVVLCSVALLSELLLFWRLSFVSIAAGIGLIAIGLLLH
ncbi:MAG: DUF4337 family protein [Terriglobales bacterium]